MVSKKIKNLVGNLEEPLPEFSGEWHWFKKGKIRIILIYEDRSYQEHFIKFKENYKFSIKQSTYIIVPECFIRGKYSTLLYFFNNPFPINMKYKYAYNNTKDLNSIETEINIDGNILKSAFDTNIVNKMYANDRMTTKNFVIIAGIILVFVLVILHATGVIDVYGFITGTTKK